MNIFSHLHLSIHAQPDNESNVMEEKENLSQTNLPINSIITWFIGGSGIATFVWGVYEYRKNRILKRQEILFDLINEFDKRTDTKSSKIRIARDLLDDLTIDENLYINKDEIKYFEYYLKRAIQNEAVMRYARLYEFESFGLFSTIGGLALLLGSISGEYNHLKNRIKWILKIL
jgi:hypothetical protein